MNQRIRVLIVDDSAIVRKILRETLEACSDIEVVGSAPDPYIARDKVLALQPDVLTLDLEMPRMDGLTFLRKLMRFRPLPVLVISSLAQASCAKALEALEAGAVEVLAKPGGPCSVGDWKRSLPDKIRSAAAARLQRLRACRPAAPPAAELPRPAPVEAARPIPAAIAGAPAVAPNAAMCSPRAVSTVAPPRLLAAPAQSDLVLAIGASTGGTEAIETVLRDMPEHCPGLVITQHIPPVFSRLFADRLNQICRIRVKEAQDGDLVEPGLALVAPGNLHMLLARSGRGFRVVIRDGPQVCYQRPSVDVLFRSVADTAGERCVAAILTGMGSDGAQGMHCLRQAGAWTIAQDEATCVVFGMPREAIRLGAAQEVLPLGRVAGSLLARAGRLAAVHR